MAAGCCRRHAHLPGSCAGSLRTRGSSSRQQQLWPGQKQHTETKRACRLQQAAAGAGASLAGSPGTSPAGPQGEKWQWLFWLHIFIVMLNEENRTAYFMHEIGFHQGPSAHGLDRCLLCRWYLLRCWRGMHLPPLPCQCSARQLRPQAALLQRSCCARRCSRH